MQYEERDIVMILGESDGDPFRPFVITKEAPCLRMYIGNHLDEDHRNHLIPESMVKIKVGTADFDSPYMIDAEDIKKWQSHCWYEGSHGSGTTEEKRIWRYLAMREPCDEIVIWGEPHIFIAIQAQTSDAPVVVKTSCGDRHTYPVDAVCIPESP